MSERDLEIRPPRWARVYVGVFSAVWCTGVVAGGVAALANRPAAAVVPALMLLLGGNLGYRLLRLSVIAEGDRLTVRNNWSTRVLDRSDVEGFRVGTPGSTPFGGKAVHVLLSTDTVLALDVTTEPYPFRRGRARLQARLEQLERWRNG